MAVVRALQGDIPLEPAPFKKIAVRLGLPEREFLGAVNRLKQRGVLRSIRAIVRHRRAGYSAKSKKSKKGSGSVC